MDRWGIELILAVAPTSEVGEWLYWWGRTRDTVEGLTYIGALLVAYVWLRVSVDEHGGLAL